MTTLNKKLYDIGHPLVYIVEDTGNDQLIGVFTNKDKAKHALLSLNMGYKFDQDEWTILINKLFVGSNLVNSDMMCQLYGWEFNIRIAFLDTINAHNNTADSESQIDDVKKVISEFN
uniref:Uncharacterized protein n=1 Tax=Pithovirus LCPAC001 TaxID=2506585 RepID=A0A481Z2R4_9VIRU|nr:MAG: hypothetical protein LCPAC001_01310 [Pithovirus LCPAC001]